MSRIKGKISRKDGAARQYQIYLPKDVANRLEEKFDYDSLSALFTALALDQLGDINLKKEKIINIEDYLQKED